MRENIRRSADGEKPGMTVGIDLGDRLGRYCVVNQEGEVIEEGSDTNDDDSAGETFHWVAEKRCRCRTTT